MWQPSWITCSSPNSPSAFAQVFAFPGISPPPSCLPNNSYSFMKIQTNFSSAKVQNHLLEMRRSPSPYPPPLSIPYVVEMVITGKTWKSSWGSWQNLHFPYFYSILENQEREVACPRPHNKLPAELRLGVKDAFSILWNFLRPTGHSLGPEPLSSWCS